MNSASYRTSYAAADVFKSLSWTESCFVTSTRHELLYYICSFLHHPVRSKYSFQLFSPDMTLDHVLRRFNFTSFFFIVIVGTFSSDTQTSKNADKFLLQLKVYNLPWHSAADFWLVTGRMKIRMLEFLAVLVTWVAVCVASPAQHVRWIALFRTTCSFCCVIPRGDATVLCWWPWWIYAHTAELFPQYIGMSRQQILATTQFTIICRLALYVL